MARTVHRPEYKRLLERLRDGRLEAKLTQAAVASAMNRLPEEDRTRIAVLLVTTDPARDDQAQLRRYLDRFDPTFEGLTGPLETIKQVAQPLSIAIEKGRKLPSGGYEIDHSTPVIGIVGDQAPIVWTEGTSPAEFADDIARLLADPPGPGAS